MKRFLVVGAALLVVFAVGAYFAGRKTVEPQQEPTPAPTAAFNSWQGAYPGKTTVSELTGLFGLPTSISQNGEQKTLYYPSTNQYWKNEVETKNETVFFMRERLFDPSERSLAVLSSQVPGQTTVLYGPDFESGYLLYAYPESGIAFYAQEDRKVVYEIWRFAPMSLRGFLSLPAASRYGTSPRPEPE